MDQSILNLVVATLSELGLPAPTNIIPTMLTRDDYFAGHKLAPRWRLRLSLRAANNVIEFYDEQGKLLKTVNIWTERGAAA